MAVDSEALHRVYYLTKVGYKLTAFVEVWKARKYIKCKVRYKCPELEELMTRERRAMVEALNKREYIPPKYTEKELSMKSLYEKINSDAQNNDSWDELDDWCNADSSLADFAVLEYFIHQIQCVVTIEEVYYNREKSTLHDMMFDLRTKATAKEAEEVSKEIIREVKEKAQIKQHLTDSINRIDWRLSRFRFIMRLFLERTEHMANRTFMTQLTGVSRQRKEAEEWAKTKRITEKVIHACSELYDMQTEYEKLLERLEVTQPSKIHGSSRYIKDTLEIL